MSENTFATNFNNVLKTLSRTYVSKKKGTFDEEKSIRNNKRLILLTQTDPMFLLINAGPVLLKYQSMISTYTMEKFTLTMLYIPRVHLTIIQPCHQNRALFPFMN